jgi:hypothetical protein
MKKSISTPITTAGLASGEVLIGTRKTKDILRER